MKFHILVISCIALSANQVDCKPRNIDGRIVGGQVAAAGQFPYAAAIYVQTSDSRFFCGGTLLSNFWILTAGQCVYQSILFQIFLGSVGIDTDNPEQLELAATTYVLNPWFNPNTLDNDIGLIRFRMLITLTDYIQPIDRLIPNEVPAAVEGYIFGWGQLSDQEAGLSNELQWVEVATMSNEVCRLTYGNQITDGMLCVEGNYNEGSCHGDTGGALIQYQSIGHVIAGVASFVSGNGCESTDPSGYTRIYPHNNWIRNVTFLHI